MFLIGVKKTPLVFNNIIFSILCELVYKDIWLLYHTSNIGVKYINSQPPYYAKKNIFYLSYTIQSRNPTDKFIYK